MSSYRSAYQNYYKNINNIDKGKKDINKYLPHGKKADKAISSKYGSNVKYGDKIMNTLIKRIITELTGAIILLLFFAMLNYIPYTKVKDIHIKCKEKLEQDFNYNEYLSSFNSIQIGNIKVKDIKLDDFTTEEVKIDDLKMNVYKFIEYLKSSSSY